MNGNSTLTLSLLQDVMLSTQGGIDAAKGVIQTWENGDLAGAVNGLRAWITSAEETLAMAAIASGNPGIVIPDYWTSDEIEYDGVRIEWREVENIAAGDSIDEPSDVLQFIILCQDSDGEWQPYDDEDGRCITAFPADAGVTARIGALKLLLDAFYPLVKSGQPVKKAVGEMAGILPDDVRKRLTGEGSSA